METKPSRNRGKDQRALSCFHRSETANGRCVHVNTAIVFNAVKQTRTAVDRPRMYQEWDLKRSGRRGRRPALFVSTISNERSRGTSTRRLDQISRASSIIALAL